VSEFDSQIVVDLMTTGSSGRTRTPPAGVTEGGG
jgi:hypothetical protein